VSSPALTVVLPVRNRAGVRLEYCLASLRWQEGVDPGDVEILLIDLGSDDAHRRAIAELAAEHGARVHTTDTSATWNRSRALNIGVKRARGRLSLCTDVDMLFSPTFLRTVIDAMRSHDDGAMILCQCRDLGPELEARRFTKGEFARLAEGAVRRPLSGFGGCQCAPTSFFHGVRGYDERFRFWGAEDKDMVYRAARAGLALEWVSDRTAMLHQWHPTVKYERPLTVRMNRARFRATSWIVKKNWLGWGE
jgi:glycosyltransferase involved in cell wall biosynthesis